MFYLLKDPANSTISHFTKQKQSDALDRCLVKFCVKQKSVSLSMTPDRATFAIAGLLEIPQRYLHFVSDHPRIDGIS